MPVRYIGRQPIQKGKTLYEICQQLANSGIGRVVYRQRHADNWPTQKSFFRLSKVIPDKTCTDFRKGSAWGQKIFRGFDYGDVQIGSGHKSDWVLVPKTMEKEFCQITDVAEPPSSVPSHVACPPWLQILLQKEKCTDKEIEIPLVTRRKLQLKR